MPSFIDDYPLILSLAILLARVADVSLGTFRMIMVFRGHRILAAVIGFFEVIIWLLAAAQVINNLDRWYLAVAYAAGFALGNYVGIWLEARFALGCEMIRCISLDPDSPVAERLRAAGFDAISFDGDRGQHQPVEIIFVIARRKRVPQLLQIIRETDPNAIYSISDVKNVYDGPGARVQHSVMDSLRQASKRR